MRALASFVMRGKNQAVLVTVLLGMLSLVIPPLSFVSSAVVALVMLRQGGRECGLVILFATVAAGLLSMMLMGNPMPALALALVFWLPSAVLASILRRTVSLGVVFNSVLVVGAAAVLAVYLITPSPSQWWTGQLEQMFAQVLQMSDAQQGEMLRSALPVLAQMMTGVMVSALLLNGLVGVLLARWWQAMLYYAGGFQKEFHALQLGKATALATAVALLAGWFAPQAMGGAAASVLVVVLSVVLFQGVAIVHRWVAAGNRHLLWLVMFYMVLVVFMKHAVVLLALLGMLDPWVDFRRRFARTDDDEKPGEA